MWFLHCGVRKKVTHFFMKSYEFAGLTCRVDLPGWLAGFFIRSEPMWWNAVCGCALPPILLEYAKV